MECELLLNRLDGVPSLNTGGLASTLQNREFAKIICD
jgi:hypothetical protein